MFLILPCIDSYQKVDLRTVSFDVPPQEVGAVCSKSPHNPILFYFCFTKSQLFLVIILKQLVFHFHGNCCGHALSFEQDGEEIPRNKAQRNSRTLRKCWNARTHARMHTHTQTNTNTRTHACTHTHTHTHTHTCVRTHTHTHTLI